VSVARETGGLSQPTDADLIEKLIERSRLSHDQVALIRELMGTARLGFVDAALQLNLISADDAAGVVERMQRPDSQAGVVETALRRQSIGRVATVPPSIYVKPSKELLLVHSPDHPHCERIRALRTELIMLMGNEHRQAGVIAVLSPGPGEGRSLLAAELAIAFAQLGRRTLLVEADLRRPRQQLLFGAENANGLAQCLSFGAVPQLLRVDGLPQFSLLPAGSPPPNPLELLSDGRFEELLFDWRRVFDVLVIDTPAITKYADGLAIASFVEQVLLLSRANSTSHKSMQDTLRRLATTRARILGAVINNF
jgi:protein-tyrosine kinase